MGNLLAQKRLAAIETDYNFKASDVKSEPKGTYAVAVNALLSIAGRDI